MKCFQTFDFKTSFLKEVLNTVSWCVWPREYLQSAKDAGVAQAVVVWKLTKTPSEDIKMPKNLHGIKGNSE